MSSSAAGLPGASAGALGAFLNRPDHLTRAATELSRWNEATELAAQASLDPRIHVVRVDAAGHERVALLTDAAQAARASRAIGVAIERVRVHR